MYRLAQLKDIKMSEQPIPDNYSGACSDNLNISMDNGNVNQAKTPVK